MNPLDSPREFVVTAVVCGHTDVGPTRAENQDAIMVAGAVGTVSGTRLSWAGVVPATGLTIAVIDGMGGYAGGADASALVATALAGLDDLPAVDLDPWLGRISQKVADAGRAWGAPGMGATAALVTVDTRGFTTANVGDCRVYRVAGRHLGQLSIDDRTDDLTSSAVTQALGGPARIDAHAWRREFGGGSERLVLCSDGVWSTLAPTALRDLCLAEHSPDRTLDAVMASLYDHAATDNCSIVVVDLTVSAVEPGRIHEPLHPSPRTVAVEHTSIGAGR